jgi:hypothetical protein
MLQSVFKKIEHGGDINETNSYNQNEKWRHNESGVI